MPGRLTLRDIATRAGLSESFLSQLERGQTGATVQSLQRIADGARHRGRPTSSRATGRSGRASLRRDDRRPFAWGKLGRKALLTPKPFESLEVVVAEFEPGGSTGDAPYTHGDSEELLYVVAGTVELTLDGDDGRPRGGRLRPLPQLDAARRLEHRPSRAEVLYMISPPSY